jgi:class 3 adenylate cyclase
VLLTILFTDIVNSTQIAATLGDDAWIRQLDRHDLACRAQIDRCSGRLVRLTGDGAIAVFAAPTLALRCALALRESVAALGMDIRAGVHSGEVALRDEDVSGIAVHVAARLQARANAGEILVSRTVRDLVVGSRLAFIDRGRRRLKGLDDPWHLFALDLASGEQRREAASVELAVDQV